MDLGGHVSHAPAGLNHQAGEQSHQSGVTIKGQPRTTPNIAGDCVSSVTIAIPDKRGNDSGIPRAAAAAL
jgi:hypothetical protein